MYVCEKCLTLLVGVFVCRLAATDLRNNCINKFKKKLEEYFNECLNRELMFTHKNEMCAYTNT